MTVYRRKTRWGHLDTSFMEHGRCAPGSGVNPAIFFSEIDRSARSRMDTIEAMQVCHSCPVEIQCRTYALDAVIRHGIWGGTTPEDRARLAGRPIRVR